VSAQERAVTASAQEGVVTASLSSGDGRERHHTEVPEVPSPNIILVTLDTLRADRIGRMLHGRTLAPNLTSLAERGRHFTRAVAAGVPTYFSFPAIFRGGLPFDGGKTIGVAGERPTFVEALKLSGYRTAAVVAWNPYLSPYYGYDRGFEVFEDSYTSQVSRQERRDRRRLLQTISAAAGPGGVRRLRRFKDKFGYVRECFDGGNPALHHESRGEAITDRALALVSDMDDDRPFFLWLHYMDLHGYFYATWEDRFFTLATRGAIDRAVLRARRYQYVDRWAKLILASEDRDRDHPVEHTLTDLRILEGFYDAAVMYTDRCLGPLFDWADASGRTVVVATSDHGEEFFEHGRIGHAPFGLYDEVARVPLIVCGPDVVRGETSEAVSHASIAAGIVEMASAGGEFGSEDERFGSAGTLAGTASSEGPVLTETLAGATVPFPSVRLPEFKPIVAAREGRYKFIWHGDEAGAELYDVIADPGETVNLVREPNDAEAASPLSRVARERALRIGVLDARAVVGERSRSVGRAMRGRARAAQDRPPSSS
jgi:arylsulfatase A-like enzyme